MKILNIEQDKDTVLRIAAGLANHEVHVDRDAAEGLAHALDASWQHVPYDTVICELVMPGLAGCGVALALQTIADARARKPTIRLRRLPVVLV